VARAGLKKSHTRREQDTKDALQLAGRPGAHGARSAGDTSRTIRSKIRTPENQKTRNQRTRKEDTVKNFGTRAALAACALNMLTWWSALPQLRAGDHSDVGVAHPQRGDVPGWVMITLMSAVLVAALLALAGPALEGLFNQAMDKVGQ
jgi:hypothetical protein